MDLSKQIARVKAILGTPRTEWPVIASEPATIGGIYKDYVLILAAIPAVFGFLKYSVIGINLPFLGTYRAAGGQACDSCRAIRPAARAVFQPGRNPRGQPPPPYREIHAG